MEGVDFARETTNDLHRFRPGCKTLTRSASSIFALTRATKSSPINSFWFRRKLSLIRRLILFRATAVGIIFFGTIKPKRGYSKPFGAASRSSPGRAHTQRKRKTDENSSVSRIFFSHPKVLSGFVVTATEPESGIRTQTAKRLRPLARRALMTARPPTVFIRARKPWVRLRRTTEG